MPVMPAMPVVPAMPTMMDAMPAMVDAMPTMVTAVCLSKRRRDSDEGHQGYNRQDLLKHRVFSVWILVWDELSRLIFRRSA